MADSELKPVDWIGSIYKDFRAFPDEVRDHMGYALCLAQTGDKHEDASRSKDLVAQGSSRSFRVTQATPIAGSTQ